MVVFAGEGAGGTRGRLMMSRKADRTVSAAGALRTCASKCPAATPNTLAATRSVTRTARIMPSFLQISWSAESSIIPRENQFDAIAGRVFEEQLQLACEGHLVARV